MVPSQRIDESRSTAEDKALQANYSGRAEVAAVARHGRAAGPGRRRRPSWVRSRPGRPRSPVGTLFAAAGWPVERRGGCGSSRF